MPWTLYSYITKEILKLLVLAATVLVLLVSMGAAMQALIKGLLDPSALIKFVLFTSPTMLQFALPFAAAFAATLVFCRMVNDNEVMACCASGLGYVTILAPVLVLGLALMLGLYYLSNTLVPAFNERAAGVIQKDVVRFMVTELHKGRAFRHRDWVIYARQAEERAPTAQEVEHLLAQGSGGAPYRVIALRDVALCMLDPAPGQRGAGAQAGGDGDAGHLPTVRQEGTAPTANVFLFEQDNRVLATAYLSEVSYFDAQRGAVYLESTWVTPLPVPSPLRDRPRFLSGRALRQFGQDPLRFGWVRTARDRLVQTMAREDLLARIVAALSAPMEGRLGQVTLLGASDEQLVVRAARTTRRDHSLVLTGHELAPVRVDVWRNGQVVRRFEAPEARISARTSDVDDEPRAHIELLRARAIDAQAAVRGTEHPSLTLAAARWQSPLTHDLAGLSVYDLEQRAFSEHPVQSAVGAAAMDLWKAIDRLHREIIAQLNMRAASAVACLFVLTLGAVLAMTLRGRAPLVIFFWSFLLALLTVIIINSGRNVLMGTGSHPLVGVGTIWSGNLILAGALAAAYLRLARN